MFFLCPLKSPVVAAQIKSRGAWSVRNGCVAEPCQRSIRCVLRCADVEVWHGVGRAAGCAAAFPL